MTPRPPAGRFSATSLLRVVLSSGIVATALVTAIAIVPAVASVFRVEITEKTSMLTASVAHEVSMLLDHAEEALRLLEFEDQRTKKGIDRVVVSFPGFESVMVLDRSGTVVLAAGASIESGYDFSRRDFFAVPMNTSSRYVSPSYISGSTYRPTVSLSIPFGRGVIVGTLDLTLLTEHVQALSPKLGELIVITDDLGYIVAHTEIERVSRRETVSSLLDFESVRAEGKGTRYIRGRNSEPTILSYQKVSGAGWIVFVAQPDEYRARLVSSVLKPAFVVAALAAFAVVLVVNLFLRRLKLDIDTLSDRTNALAQGDYPVPVEYRGFSDFGRLVDNFNRMAEAVAERERELRLNEIELRKLIDRTPVAMVVEDSDGRIIAVNAKFRETFGWDISELKTIDDWWKKAYPDPAYREAMRQLWLELLMKRSIATGEIAPVEATAACRDGAQRHVEMRTANIGERTVILFNDLTERKETERAIRSSEEKYRTVFETSGDAMFVIDAKTSFVLEANRNASLLFGYDKSEFQTMDAMSLMRESGPPALGDGPGPCLSCRRKDGTEFPAEIQMAETTVAGREVTVIGVRDITYKREAELRLLTNLGEKEVLLREIHHRVKNNLQLIISLLTLQKPGNVLDGRDRSFGDAIDRIRVLSTIHEMLYESRNLSSIDFAEYVRTITESLASSYDFSGGAPELALALEPVQLGIDTAITCGLIVNELVTNALKYAFLGDTPLGDTPVGDTSGSVPSRDAPRLEVSLRETPDARVVFEVSDNGRGIPASIEPETSTTLGIQLVVLLTRQLDGNWELDRSNGTRWTVSFTRKR